MKIQTRIFVAKQFAKKHYASAMDAMKSLKGKFKKPTGMKAKAMAAGSKIKTFASLSFLSSRASNKNWN